MRFDILQNYYQVSWTFLIIPLIAGEILRMSHVANGVDENGQLQLVITVTGEVPDIPDHANIVLKPYTEDYIQIGPGQIYGTSERIFTWNGMPLPYSWNHTITYDDPHSRMPYLVETLRVQGIKVNYDPFSQFMTFEVGTVIEEGE